MALNDVYSALSAALSAGRIDLYGAGTGALAPLRTTLALFSIRDSYRVLNAALLPPTNVAVTLTGTAKFGPGAGSNVSVRLVCTQTAGAGPDDVTFAVTLTVTDPGWTFGTMFPTLPECQVAQPGGSVQWQPSFLSALRVDQASFSAANGDTSLSFAGSLLKADRFQPYEYVVSDWPLPLTGTVTLPASWDDPPALDLKAVSNGSLDVQEDTTDGQQLLAGDFQLPVRNTGFQLLSVTDLDPTSWGRTAFSALNLIGTLHAGKITADLFTPILAVNDSWHLVAQFPPDQNPPVVEAMGQLTQLFGLPALPVPENFIDVAGFQFRTLEVWLRPPTGGHGAALDYLALTIQSDRKWTAPVPYVALENVGIRWVLGWSVLDGGRFFYTSGSVFGTLKIGPGSSGVPSLPPVPKDPSFGTFSLDVSLAVPSWAAQGELKAGDNIPIGAALAWFFGQAGPDTESGMQITGLTFLADPSNQSYAATAEITFISPKKGWTIDLGVTHIVLEQLGFGVSSSSGKISGSISAALALPDATQGDNPPQIVLSANYPEQTDASEGWLFSGLLYPGVPANLTLLVGKFLFGGSPPAWVPTLQIDQLQFETNTGKDRHYSFMGAASASWPADVFDGYKLSLAASLALAKNVGDAKPSGWLEGGFNINKIGVTARLSLGAPEATYLFRVQFNTLELEAVTSWRGDGTTVPRHQVLQFQLSGATLGSLLEYLVNLAQPTLGYKLDPPWDVLNRIDLSRFTVTVDPKLNTIDFVYDTHVNLYAGQLDSVGVRYSRAGNDGTVDLLVTGSLLGRSLNATWDVVNDPPPAVPGQGSSALDLRFLGFGQHVTLDAPLPDTVADTVALLRKTMQEPESGKYPLSPGVRFSADSEWLIGLDIGLLDTVDLAIVFNDPVLYGLSIALNGSTAGALAGLRFEILYKKITNSIGMYRIELRIPEAFRHIELGEVSISLGIVVLEIYTNGNFLVDLGFPYNRNYDRSFTVSVFPFIGRGGFYFGLLDGNTSRRVPRVTNGAFSRVLELGIGLAVGVGKEITVGPLSGGISVEVEVIFQGVLAWFQPSDASASTAMYYRGQGIAAIHGKVYGVIDFKIIKVSATIEAFAQASVVFEAHQPTLFAVSVGVSVEAEVTFLFFSISFSFSAQLDLSFTVGSATPTPWLIAGNGGAPSLQSRFAHAAVPALQRNGPRRTAVLRAHHVNELRRAAMTAAPADTPKYDLHWNPSFAVFGTESPRKMPVTLLPSFTVADVPVSWDGKTVPPNPSPKYRVAFVLMADTGVSAHAASAADTAQRSAALSAHAASATDTDYLPADTLVQGLLLYAINALPGVGDTVTAGQLQHLADLLTWSETTLSGFSLDSLGRAKDGFFATNIHWALSGDPGGAPAQKSGMVLPLPPFLSWVSPQGGNVDFGDGCSIKVGPWYEQGVADQLNRYLQMPSRKASQETDDPAQYESMAAFVFRDFCLATTRAAVDQALDALTNFRLLPLEAGQTLKQIADALPQATVSYAVRAGDTVDSVATALGATATELEFLNPDLAHQLETKPVGASLDVTLGVAPETLATDNADVLFAVHPLSLGTVPYQVRSGDTLNGIAGRFNVSAASLFAGTTLGDGRQLLQAGALFNAPAVTYTPPSGTTIDRVLAAAMFFVRDTQFQDGMTAWYAQVVADMNKDRLQDSSGPELPPGLELRVPSAYENRTPAGQSYRTVPGDTLLRIGAMLSLAQNQASATGTPWATFRDATAQKPDGSVQIPAQPNVPVLPGETPAMLARRTIVLWREAAGGGSADWDGLISWMGDAPILTPLAVVPVPNATTGKTPDSFSSLSSNYGLSISDAALQLQVVPGLFAENTVLKVSHLPARAVSDLAADVVTGERLARVVHQGSRMLLAGLQLPRPVPDAAPNEKHMVAKGPLAPLYDLTLQQFDLPLDWKQPDASALSVVVSSEAGWITFTGSTVVGADESVAQLRARLPQAFLPEINRGLAAGQVPAPGMVVHTGATPTLSFNYTSQELLAKMPATGLVVAPTSSPSAMKLSGAVKRTYGFDHHIALQTQTDLKIPSGPTVSGQPGLWPFSDNFRSRAVAGATTPYELLCVRQGDGSTDSANPVTNSTFGTVVSFRIHQWQESLTRFELIGAEVEDRDLLLSLYAYLSKRPTIVGDPSAPSDAACLLVAPAPDAGNATGLTVLSPDVHATRLIKTNLSTETVPTPQAAAVRKGDGTPLYLADFSQLSDFLLLLLEGSLVGGKGYVFTLGLELPASALDRDGNATLSLLVIVQEQQSKAETGRTLLQFNNCVLVGPGLDPSTQALFAESFDESDLITQSLVPAGSVGFTLTTQRPTWPAPSTFPSDLPASAVDLQRRYGLLTYEVPAVLGAPFSVPPSGLVVTPAADDNSGLTAVQRAVRRRRHRVARLAATPEPVQHWRFDQVIPLARFATATSPAPKVTGLPPPDADPYCGVGTASSLPEASFQLGFGDVQGNRTTPATSGPGAVSVPVGYTDTLLGVSAWPSVNLGYSVAPASGSVTLNISLSSKPSALMPTLAQRGDVRQSDLVKQAEKYATIYYQQIQPGLAATVLTTLAYDAAGEGTPIADVSPLSHFAAGAYVAAGTAASLKAVLASGTLQHLVDTYGVRWGDVAEANATSLMRDLFCSTGQPPPSLEMPAFIALADGETATSLAAAAASRAGWPAPTAEAILLVKENAGDLPLRPGVALLIPAAPVLVPVDPSVPTLEDLARDVHTSAVYLATASADDAILAPHFTFTVDGASVTTSDSGGAIRTFNAVVAAFANQGVILSVADLALANASAQGLLAGGATAHRDRYIVRDSTDGHPDTLMSNASGASLDDLASLNVGTPNLFDPGALVFLGTFGSGSGVSVNPTQTLREFADSYGCPVAQLLQRNAGFPLPSSTVFAAPGVVEWPGAPVGQLVPYTVRPGDVLATIATAFLPASGNDDPLTNLVTMNTAMLGLIAGGQTFAVPVGTQTVMIHTHAGDTFTTLLAQLVAQAPAGTMADLVRGACVCATLLQPGALLLCPPALIGAAVTPEAIFGRYGVDGTSFALANAGVLGLVAPGQTLSLPTQDEDNPLKVQTQASDTLNAVLARFMDAALAAHQPQALSLADIVTANASVPFFAASGIALLPPAAVTLPVPISASGPYPDGAFPLSVTLRLARPAALVHPDFPNDGPVQRSDSVVPAPAQSSTTDGTGSLTFEAFVRDMWTAFPNLRLATGKVAGHDRDLWAVNFGASGISNVTLVNGVTYQGATHMARCLALPPLYDHLVSRTVPIPSLVDGKLADPPVQISYQAIDVEVWAQRFLSDLDLLLSTPYAASLSTDATMQEALQQAIQAKQILAKKIPQSLKGILALKDPSTPNGVDDPNAEAGAAYARDALGQQLAISLSHGYATPVILQCDAQVKSPWIPAQAPKLPPAQLFGDARGLSGTDRPWSLSSARTALDVPSTFVTFLMTIAQPANHRSLDVDLTYDIGYLESNIAAVPDAGSYVSSDWLSFVPLPQGCTPPSSLHTRPGETRVPIPLRAFPPLPIVAVQTALPTASDSTSFADLSQWTYGLSYTHEHAEQDDVEVTAEFNLTVQPRLVALSDPIDLFSELAKYIAVADDLWALLKVLATAPQQVPQSTIDAAATFATLAGNVADQWEVRLPEAAGFIRQLGDGTPYRFTAQVDRDEAGALKAYTLKRLQDAPGPAGQWPSVSCLDADGSTVPFDLHPNGDAVRYVPRTGAPVLVPAWPEFTLEWAGLNVSTTQNARATLAVGRNRKLLGPDGPDTATAFILKTATVQAAEIVTPLIIQDERLPLTGTSLQTALDAALDAMFPAQGRTLGLKYTAGLFYGYELIPDGVASLTSEVPAALYPNQILSSSTGHEIEQALTNWLHTRGPNRAGGEWVISFTLYSSCESPQRPLLTLQNLYYALPPSLGG